MPHGLPRKIRIAFLLQGVLASLAILLGGYLVSLVIKHSLINTVLKEEATYYWGLYQASPVQPPPNTQNIRGYLLERGQSSLNLPANLRPLEPGFHELPDSDQLVLVDQRPAGRLYLVFLRSQAERLAFWFGIVPVLLILLAVYGVSWITYRSSRRLVSPVNWLARRISHWDPRHPEAADLAPERLPADMQGETRQLAASLHSLATRVTEHVSRERNFTRDASHELRTPLTVIRVASDMAMGDPELTPRLQRGLQRIQRAGRDMEAVIDAFLILARESDIEPQSELFEVADVVRYEADNARELLAGRPVQLHVHVNGPSQLHAPPRVMQVVVSNLLRNACSYTDEGHIDVEVAADRVVIRDTGIGMSADALARVFEPFFRAEPSRPQGTGLGLSIVRRLCDRFGWQVQLSSEPGRGTVATVRFA
ncbi:HAMP domain-containing histidine kinase [Flavobacterium sp. MXW15]|uniref:histidine kinase n=1 Tax=Xanthomonas chitinilytica TaxID=2989819 RepID=A0ABT3JSA6_9XANT|nr:HAMP domain-containing sensor histidine kinase [Xanthomonas sp. H13-6]MCW4454142.1 HAMP domain-containing histidine kinase [Flavobacterium sp. MXW15]MCW4471376.1 HAMP domain-containing histidine kinase [Xanthomonas sp. H13-6]